MANSLVEMMRVKELRKKIIITILLLIVTRIGTVIPIPGVDPVALRAAFQGAQNGTVGLTEYLNFFSGGAFSNFSVFMLGVMPYITAQIILQLLMIIIPSLKRMAQEPSGAKKIQKYTRWGTIIVCVLQALMVTAYANIIEAQTGVSVITPSFSRGAFTAITLIACTAGTMAEVWIGDRITNSGVGNGISLLIFAGIVARIPEGIATLISGIQKGDINIISVVILLVMFIALVILVVYEEKGVKKIFVTYSKRVVGRKVYGAQSTHIPLKINPSGVIPVIFASALLTLPIQIASTWGPNVRWLQRVADYLNPQGWLYITLYTILIIAFAFFYTQVTLNPIEIAKNIRDNGGSIQGVRADKMEEYLTKILNRIVLPGAIFLAFIALVPTLVQLIFKFPPNVAMLFGGTSLLILVGVDLDTMRSIEGIMKMHHGEGFVKKGKGVRGL